MFNVLQDWAASYWAELGAPKDKLVLGLALYGRSFTLAKVAENGVGDPISGPGWAGIYTGEAGFLSYYEVRNDLKNNQNNFLIFNFKLTQMQIELQTQ